MIQTETKPSTGTPTKMLCHILKRNEDGTMPDTALCGKLWDRPFNTSNNICPECIKIAKERGYKVFGD